MRRLGLAAVLAVISCERNLDIPEPAPPPGPGSIYGRVVCAKPGVADRLPAPGASIALLSSSLQTHSKDDGAFLLSGITVATGDVLFRYDSDGDGTFDRQRIISLAQIGAGPGHDIALGDVTLSENAQAHGKATRS